MKATRDGYGEGLLAVAPSEPRLVALDGDLGKATRGAMFAKQYPHRHFNIGISEQDMMIIAAGLAHEGKIPFAASFGIFTERAFEQIRNGICRPNLNVKIVGTHAGLLTGQDGSSAQCLEDLSVYRTLPNMIVISPADYYEARAATIALAKHHGPAYLRLGRDALPFVYDESYEFTLGAASQLREGGDVTIIGTGTMVYHALQAAKILEQEGVLARVLNVHTLKPIDQETIIRAARETGALVTCEDHLLIGGLGGAVAEVLALHHPAPLEMVGVDDKFGESGKPEELYQKYGLTAEHIVAAAKKAMGRKRG